MAFRNVSVRATKMSDSGSILSSSLVKEKQHQKTQLSSQHRSWFIWPLCTALQDFALGSHLRPEVSDDGTDLFLENAENSHQVRVTLRTIVWPTPSLTPAALGEIRSWFPWIVPEWRCHMEETCMEWWGAGRESAHSGDAADTGQQPAVSGGKRAVKTREDEAESEHTFNRVPRASDTLGCFFQWLLGDLSKPRSQT